jgi:hypothetical protein
MLIKLNSKLIKLKFDHRARCGCTRGNALGESGGAAPGGHTAEGRGRAAAPLRQGGRGGPRQGGCRDARTGGGGGGGTGGTRAGREEGRERESSPWGSKIRR